MMFRPAWIAVVALFLGACGTAPKKSEPSVAAPSVRAESPPTESATADAKRSPYAPAQEDPSKRGDYVAGGLYAPHIKDSVPDEVPDVEAIPEPEVKSEQPSRYGNRSYSVQGKTYRVLASSDGYVEQGMASFYGKKFHGRLTSNQEVYDMYAFTAAHRSLPLPSYVRVTNLSNGKTVVVRVNDRGPFHSHRIIDLSYAAAVKLDFVGKGVARVEVRALNPGERRTGSRRERDRRADERANEQTAVVASAPKPVTAPDPTLRADEFDRWMRERGIRIASGKPEVPARQTPDGGGSLESADPPRAQPSAPESPAATMNATSAVSTAGTGVTLQVAAFSARDNAERAQQRLQEAGLPALRIDEANVNGQPVWRLRIGPVAAERAQELSARCADLGFDAVRVVRE
jgi:rare lipoprotein A